MNGLTGLGGAPTAARPEPRLRNPLLDALFGPPPPLLRGVLHELEAYTQYTVLVPPAQVLLGETDGSGRPLADLCRQDEFVRSHILRNNTCVATLSHAGAGRAQLYVCSTMNGKQVLLKNNCLFTGKGFRRSMRVKALAVAHMAPVLARLPHHAQVCVVHLATSLYGPVPALEPGQAPPKAPSKHSTLLTFDDLLRNYPLLAAAMSPAFQALFHHNNRQYERLRTRQRMPVDQITLLFAQYVAAALDIVQASVGSDGSPVRSLLQAITRLNPETNLDSLIHEYVELNVYDRVWLLLVWQLSETPPGVALTPDFYADISCLALSQLDIPVAHPWHLNVLYRRVAAAIKVFSVLALPAVTNQRQKADVLARTIEVLTSSDTALPDRADEKPHSLLSLTIDADTLVGLLVMVVAHSKVPNLEAHLHYVRHFGVPGSDLGFASYILSNIDAVVFHLRSHHADMAVSSAANYRLWFALEFSDLPTVKSLVEDAQRIHPHELPSSHFLRCKNINGESCLNFAIRLGSPEIFAYMLDSTARWISVEDILFDKNTTTNQTLLMVALQKETPGITLHLLDLLLACLSPQELRAYLACKDAHGRTVAHYLSHDLDALDRLGGLVDWTTKDNSSQTALFCLCRCFDHPDYSLLVEKAFAFIDTLTLDVHTDKNGNTVLHALARGAELVLPRFLVDVNALNKKNLTPAVLYLRYSRVDNMRQVLRDPRFYFDMEEPVACYTLMDYYLFLARKFLKGHNQDFPEIEKLLIRKWFERYPQKADRVGFLNAKFDASSADWLVNVVTGNTTKYVALEKIRQCYKLQKSATRMNFLPGPEVFWANFASGSVTVATNAKYHSNRALEHLAIVYAAMAYLAGPQRKQALRLLERCMQDSHSAVYDAARDLALQVEALEAGRDRVKLTQLHVREIFYFTDFTARNLSKYADVITRFQHLCSLASCKGQDLRSALDHFLTGIDYLGSAPLDIEHDWRSIDQSVFPAYLLWLVSCARELVRNCELLVKKLNQWEETYTKVRALNTELKKYEDLVPPGTHLEPVQTQDDLLFFRFGLGDTKKSRYRKLAQLKAEEVDKLMEANLDIKLDHEALATSVSEFMDFRAKFLKYAIKQHVLRTLVLLRNRQYELSRAVLEVKRR